MHRVYFDTNEGCRDGYGLWLNASREDLARIPDGPRDGMTVIIYMTDELEMEAVLAFDSDQNVWTALPVPGTTKYAQRP
jgi:hypothetical protein